MRLMLLWFNNSSLSISTDTMIKLYIRFVPNSCRNVGAVYGGTNRICYILYVVNIAVNFATNPFVNEHNDKASNIV